MYNELEIMQMEFFVFYRVRRHELNTSFPIISNIKLIYKLGRGVNILD